MLSRKLSLAILAVLASGPWIAETSASLSVHQKASCRTAVDSWATYNKLVSAERSTATNSKAYYRITSAASMDLSVSPLRASKENFTNDSDLVQSVLSHRSRWSEKKLHTLQVNKYIERHLSQRLMKFLSKNPDIKIDILQSDPLGIRTYLNSQGYDQTDVLPANGLTDFDVVIGLNTSTGELKLALGVLEGESYLREAAANLTYYYFKEPGAGAFAISPQRISVLRSHKTAREIFKNILTKNAIDPDVVILAYATNFEEGLAASGISPKSRFSDRQLSGRTYTIQGRSILSVNIEPELYGDRAGDFIRALHDVSPRRRAVIVIGSAGSLLASIRVNDFVIPENFAMRDGIENITWSHTQNLALNTRIPRANFEPRIFRSEGCSQATVSSILFEDEEWAKKNSLEYSPDGAAVVEQEGFGLATAAQETNALFWAAYRIVDEPLNNLDFSIHHSSRHLWHTLFQLQMKFLESALQALPR